jgi:hypothetical protein
MNYKFNEINKDNISLKSKKFKKKYGGFSYKDRGKYLLNNQLIDYNNFTYISSDYTIINLKNTLKSNNIKNIYKKNKEELFQLVCSLISNNIYSNKLIFIIKIQSNIRRYLNNINSIRGIGYYYRDKCKNDEDFFYFISKDKIEDIYFFSYKDDKNNIWCFDIRSFNKLIISDNRNPYTREIINKNVIEKSKKLTKYLVNKKIDINIEEFNHENKLDRIRQKTVDIFSSISYSGYEININWFLSLDINKLKQLYKSLEDIWNYRAYITPEYKRILVPPNGLIFRYPVRQIYLLQDKLEIMEIILNEISKSNNAVNLSDKQQGYMFFLIGLSEVSSECLNSHQWIQYAN